MSGPSGAVSYPAHIAEVHAEVIGYDTTGSAITESLSQDMLTIVNDMWAVTNPYTSKSPYVPDTDLALLGEDLDYFRAACMGSNEMVTWAAMLAKVEESIDILIPTDDELEAEVQAMSEDQEIALAQAYNRISAGFFDNLAVISTAFPTAFAVLEAQHKTNLAVFESKLRAERNRDRLSAYLQSITNMTQIMQIRIQGLSATYQAHDTYAKAKITAYNNEIGQEADMRTNEAYWDLRILDAGARVIGSTAGIPGMSEGMSKWQMGLMTLSTIASIGTGLMGSMVGGMSSMLPMLMMMI